MLTDLMLANGLNRSNMVRLLINKAWQQQNTNDRSAPIEIPIVGTVQDGEVILDPDDQRVLVKVGTVMPAVG